MAKDKQAKTSLATRFRNYLFTGILVTAPAVITIYLVIILVNYIDSKVTPFIPAEYNPNTYLPFGIPGLGVLIIIVLLICIGMFATGFLGRFFIRLWDKIISSTPVISSIYNALKQIFETFFSSSAKQSFRKVVLIEYPRKGLWTAAFVTGTPTEEIKDICDEDDMISVYVPTTPNPTSGFLIFLPSKDVHPLDISVEDGLKFVISVGIVAPMSNKEKLEKTILNKTKQIEKKKGNVKQKKSAAPKRSKSKKS